MRERLYLDSCVLNRSGDDQAQSRIRAEAEAIEHIFDLAAADAVTWVVSDFLHAELARNPDSIRRDDSLVLLELASERISPTPGTFMRARTLRAHGFGDFDALHLSIAEESNVTTLLTVDDRFLKLASRRPGAPLPRVENPVDWLRGRQPWLIKR